MSSSVSSSASALLTRDAVASRLKSRYRAENRFRFACASALVVGGLFLAVLFTSIISQGYTAFTQHFVGLEVYFDPDVIDPAGNRDRQVLASANYNAIVRDSMKRQFPDVTGRTETRKLTGLVSNSAPYELQSLVETNPAIIGTTETVWVPASDDIDMLLKGKISRGGAEETRRVSDNEIAWIDTLEKSGLVDRRFNKRFFTAGDSREPELAGIWGAVVGSAYTMLVCLALSFPLGIAAAIYLEEFAPKNRLTDLIEVNINNLAAVPSIVYGLLGLAVFLNFFTMPRSAPLVGGIVLSLMTLPRIIIPARAAMQSIPPSIEEAAYGLGASPMQVMFHHILPLSLPGILTGTIIGMAQALGETAPLLMIGMVAFIVDVPASIFDPATVLPVQVYLWADSPERAFVEKTSAAIMVLLAFLIVMNLAAVIIRRKTERKW
jgi:phosphate transport system permease protein